MDEEAGEVVHQVEASLYPNWVGSEQRRRYRIDGNRLTLQVVREKGGKRQIASMVWERTGAQEY